MSFAGLDPVRALLAEAPFTWAFAGGWAIDLFAGEPRRTHGDIDIAIQRRDQTALFEHLPGWRWQATRGGTSMHWTGAWLDPPIHELRACGPDGAEIEFLLNETDGLLWHFRRDARVTAPLGSVFVRAGAYPVLAPEIALLYKAKLMQPKDHEDFAATAPLLSGSARNWFRNALGLAHPDHPWLSVLG